MKAIMSLLLLSISTIVQINAQTQAVRPGDFNMDGIVNVADALYWGLAHGETGPPRLEGATIDWIPQSADDWDESINLVNNKYQDADGNGVIDTLDLQALYMNYDSTHVDTIKGMINANNGVWFTYYAETNAAGIKMNRYSMRLKEDTLHGIAFTFDYSNFGSAAIDVAIDTSNLWLGSGDVLVQVLQEAEYQLHVAVTRTNQGDIQIGGDVVLNIVVSEPVAALTDQPEVYIKNGEIIRADETRQTIAEHYYQTPAPPKPECLSLWNGEACMYENGIINHPEAMLNQYNEGFCFEGRLHGDDVATISMGCDNLSEVYNVCDLDTLWFYAKTDLGGIQETAEFYISDTNGNIGHAIPINNLDTAYQRIAIPINTLMDKDCPLEDLAWVHFRKAQNTSDFRIYIDEIHADYEWVQVWKGDLCYYHDGTLNEEDAYNGRYCYERVIDEDDDWHHSAVTLWCEDAPYNLSLSDEIQFYAKADKEGKSFNVYLSEAHIYWNDCDNGININDYIQGDSLTTDYRLVRIPIDSLKTAACAFENVDGIHFYNHDDIDFKFYIDDIRVYSKSDPSCTALPPVVIPNTQPAETSDPSLTVYPNPVQSMLNIDIHYPQSTPAELFIIDLQGQILYQSHTMLSAGNNRLSYATGHLSAGMYVAQIRDNNGYTTARKFVIIK